MEYRGLLVLCLALLVVFLAHFGYVEAQEYQKSRAVERITNAFSTANQRAPKEELFFYAEVLVNECLYQKVPVDLAAAVLIRESSVIPDSRSHKGALGLMQIMPSVWYGALDSWGLDMKHGLIDPETNIKAGVLILKQYLLRAKGDAFLALAYYNAGPSRWHLGAAYAEEVVHIAKR